MIYGRFISFIPIRKVKLQHEKFIPETCIGVKQSGTLKNSGYWKLTI